MSPRLNLTNYSTHDKTHHPFLCWNMTDEGWFGLKREASIPENAESEIRFKLSIAATFPVGLKRSGFNNSENIRVRIRISFYPDTFSS